MDMNVLVNYIKPELLVVVPVLWFVGKLLKESKVKDEYIPLILTLLSVILCVLFVLATVDMVDNKSLAMGLFTAFTQGIICVGLAVYGNQLVRQAEKLERVSE